MPLADATTWPDAFDLIGLAYFAAIALGVPLLGYVLMALDYRAYLRSLRRALVVIRGYTVTLPDWVRQETPACLHAFGLRHPCTQADVLAAYREKVKTAHPDRGGSRSDFAKLQQNFEQAMKLLEEIA